MRRKLEFLPTTHGLHTTCIDTVRWSLKVIHALFNEIDVVMSEMMALKRDHWNAS
jgi:hypothetical protein